MIIVLMGVSGAGKTTVGTALASALGLRFVEGDAFHGDANRSKMAAGQPLTDADRWPWLDALGAEIAAIDARGEGAVLACSALRRSYRDRLRRHVPGLHVVLLAGDAQRIGSRLDARRGHYMPPSLLASQFDALEVPGPDEDALVMDVAGAPETLAARIAAALGH